MRYSYKVNYVPGKQLVLADCLSRNPTEDSLREDLTEEIDHYVHFVTSHLPATKNLLQRIKDEQGRDYICSKLKEYCINKWPTKDRLPNGLSVY